MVRGQVGVSGSDGELEQTSLTDRLVGDGGLFGVDPSGQRPEFVPTVELQLLKGGVRTAWFLNNIFGGWPVGSP